MGGEAVDFADRGTASFRDGGEVAGAGHGEQSRAVGGAFLGGQKRDGLGQDIGEKLRPEGAFGSAAGEADVGDGHVEAGDDIEAVALGVADAFEDGAEEIGAGVGLSHPQ